jgi:hypothetical protein
MNFSAIQISPFMQFFDAIYMSNLQWRSSHPQSSTIGYSAFLNGLFVTKNQKPFYENMHAFGTRISPLLKFPFFMQFLSSPTGEQFYFL